MRYIVICLILCFNSLIAQHGVLIFTTTTKSYGNLVYGDDYTVSGNTLYLRANREFIFDNVYLGPGTILRPMPAAVGERCHVLFISAPIGNITIDGIINTTNTDCYYGQSTITVTVGNITFNLSGSANGGAGGSVTGNPVQQNLGFGGPGGGGNANVPSGSRSGGSGGPVLGQSVGSPSAPQSYTRTTIGYGGYNGNSGNLNGGGGGAVMSQVNYCDAYPSCAPLDAEAIAISGNGGGNNFGASGTNGVCNLYGTSGKMNCGAGGGGGASGRAGLGGAHLYIKARNILGSGQIYTSGLPGGPGGNGGSGMSSVRNVGGGPNTYTDTYTFGGSGGGGGGGGNGGYVYFNYSINLAFTGQIYTSGAPGGSGGSAPTGGNAGSAGSNGVAGQVITGTYSSLSITSVNISPALAYKSTPFISCTVNYLSGSPSINITYEWYQNNTLRPDLSGVILNVPNTGSYVVSNISNYYYFKNETWRCRVRISDGVNNETRDSNNLTILNSLPSVPTINAPINNSITGNSSIILSWYNSTDIDGDPISYYLCYGNTSLTPTCLTVSVNFSTVSLAENSTLFWKVAANDSQNLSEFSPIFQVIRPFKPQILGCSPDGAVYNTNLITLTCSANFSNYSNTVIYNYYLRSLNEANFTRVYNDSYPIYNINRDESIYLWYAEICDEYACSNTSNMNFTVNIDVPIVIINLANNSTLFKTDWVNYSIIDFSPKNCILQWYKLPGYVLDNQKNVNCFGTQTDITFSTTGILYFLILNVSDGVNQNSSSVTVNVIENPSGGGGGGGGGGGNIIQTSINKSYDIILNENVSSDIDVIKTLSVYLNNINSLMKLNFFGFPLYLIIVITFGVIGIYDLNRGITIGSAFLVLLSAMLYIIYGIILV